MLLILSHSRTPLPWSRYSQRLLAEKRGQLSVGLFLRFCLSFRWRFHRRCVSQLVAPFCQRHIRQYGGERW